MHMPEPIPTPAPVRLRMAPGALGRLLPRPAALVICTGCEAQAYTAPGHLPADWQVVPMADAEHAFCGDCAAAMPDGEDL